jgi:thiamine-phosphate diphosphorylase/hydroxyethylthiazole kinase
VTVNQLANATIALGGSPIMATAMKEMQDLSKIASSLLVNMGTVDDHNSMLLAGRCANNYRKPVIFDPVGIGATSFRKDVANGVVKSYATKCDPFSFTTSQRAPGPLAGNCD